MLLEEIDKLKVGDVIVRGVRVKRPGTVVGIHPRHVLIDWSGAGIEKGTYVRHHKTHLQNSQYSKQAAE